MTDLTYLLMQQNGGILPLLVLFSAARHLGTKLMTRQKYKYHTTTAFFPTEDVMIEFRLAKLFSVTTDQLFSME